MSGLGQAILQSPPVQFTRGVGEGFIRLPPFIGMRNDNVSRPLTTLGPDEIPRGLGRILAGLTSSTTSILGLPLSLVGGGIGATAGKISGSSGLNPAVDNPFRSLTLESLVRAMNAEILDGPVEKRLAAEALMEKIQNRGEGPSINRGMAGEL